MSLQGEWKRLKRRVHRLGERLHAWRDAARVRARNAAHPERVLFVDGGSNLGQGFEWFARRYDDGKIAFHLFEPNPNCHPALERLRARYGERMEIHAAALGTAEGEMKFYGLAEGGELSQGGSLLKSHNSTYYEAREDAAIEVRVMDFPAYLERQSERFDTIVVKMDIEGAEIDLLEALLEGGAHRFIDTLYVEFHAQYQAEPERSRLRARERALVARLKATGMRVRIWH